MITENNKKHSIVYSSAQVQKAVLLALIHRRTLFSPALLFSSPNLVLNVFCITSLPLWIYQSSSMHFYWILETWNHCIRGTCKITALGIKTLHRLYSLLYKIQKILPYMCRQYFISAFSKPSITSVKRPNVYPVFTFWGKIYSPVSFIWLGASFGESTRGSAYGNTWKCMFQRLCSHCSDYMGIGSLCLYAAATEYRQC